MTKAASPDCSFDLATGADSPQGGCPSDRDPGAVSRPFNGGVAACHRVSGRVARRESATRIRVAVGECQLAVVDVSPETLVASHAWSPVLAWEDERRFAKIALSSCDWKWAAFPVGISPDCGGC
jgi:hypothetical protein